MNQYLVVNEDGACFIDESSEAMRYALINELRVRIYKISVDEYNRATLKELTNPLEVK
jgi:hypothetical protein